MYKFAKNSLKKLERRKNEVISSMKWGIFEVRCKGERQEEAPHPRRKWAYNK